MNAKRMDRKETEKGWPSSPKHYAAFISYRHLSPDQEIAQALHRKLEHNQVRPNRSVPRNIRPVFLDTGELPTLEDLDAGIYQALENSDCLFVICSPNLPLSKYCMREIEYFKKIHGGRLSRVYTVLVAGEPGEAFPEILRTEERVLPDGAVETVEVEPLFADVRAPDLHGSIKKLKKTEYLRLAAAYYGCSFDALYKRHRRWVWRIAGVAAAGVLLVAAGFGVYSWYNRVKYDSAKAATYAAYAEDRIRAGEEPLAIALTEEGWDAAVSSGSQRLMTAMRSAAVQYDYKTRALPVAPMLSVEYENDQNTVFYILDEGRRAVVNSNHILQVNDAETGALLQRTPMDSMFLLGKYATHYVTIRAEKDENGVLWDTATLRTVLDNQMVGSRYPFRQSGQAATSYSVMTAVETDAVITICDYQKAVAYLTKEGQPISAEEAAEMMMMTQKLVQAEETPFRVVQGGTTYERGKRVSVGCRVLDNGGETVLTMETDNPMIAFSADWGYFASAENGHIRIYDTEKWTVQAEQAEDEDRLMKIYLMRDAPYILLHDQDGEGRHTVRLIDWRTWEILLETEGYPYVSSSDRSFYCVKAGEWTKYVYSAVETDRYEVIDQRGSLCLAVGTEGCCLVDTASGLVKALMDGARRGDVCAANDLSRILFRTKGRLSCLDNAGTLLWETETDPLCFALSPDGSVAAWVDEDGIRAVSSVDGSSQFYIPGDTAGYPQYPESLAVSQNGACITGEHDAVWFQADGDSVALGDYKSVRLYGDGLLFLENPYAHVYDFAVWDTALNTFLYQPAENTGPWTYHADSGWLVRQLETSGNHITWDLEILRRKEQTFESKGRVTLPGVEVTDLRVDSSGGFLSVTAGGTTRVYRLKDQFQVLSVENCDLFYEDDAFRASVFRGVAQYFVPILDGTELRKYTLALITSSSGVRMLTEEELSRYSFSD